MSRDRHEIDEEEHDDDQAKPGAGDEVHYTIEEEHENGEDQRPQFLVPKADRHCEDDNPDDQNYDAPDGSGHPERAGHPQSTEARAGSAEDNEQAEDDDEEPEDSDQDSQDRDAQRESTYAATTSHVDGPKLDP